MNSKTCLGLIAGLLAIAPAAGDATTITQLQFRDGASYFGGGPTYAGTQDTFIFEQDTSFNYGASPTLTISDRFVDRDALIRFGMTGVTAQLDSYDVTSASLTFTTLSFSNPSTQTIYDLFLVTPSDSGWLEGTASATTPAVGTGATYSHEIYNTTAWAGGNTRTSVGLTTAGTIGTQIASIDIGASPMPGDTFTFNFAGAAQMALIESWLDGGANGGFVILSRGRDFNLGNPSFDSPFWNVHSSEAALITNRPLFTLNGTFTLVPEPSTASLLGVIGVAFVVFEIFRRRRWQALAGG